MKCPKCYADIPQGGAFCGSCGSPVPPEQLVQMQMQPQVKKSKSGLIAAIASIISILVIIVSVLIIWHVLDEPSDNEQQTTETGGHVADGTEGEVKHTIMVYMIGSDLETDDMMASTDIQEIMAAEYGEDVRVVIQTGGARKWWLDEIEDGQVQRFEVKTGELIELENLGQVNMSIVDTLSDFITFASKKYVSDKYTLVLWNHGGGIPISFGEDELYTEDMLSDAEVGIALADANVQFESIVMDACNMCTLEVAMAVKDYAKYMVAAESITAGTGMCYVNWLDYMGQNAEASGSEYCELLVSAYMDSLEGTNYVASMSYVDLSKIEQVYEAYIEYIQSVLLNIKAGDYVAYAKAREACGLYKGSDSADIITLATNYATDKSSALINAVVNAVGYTESDYLYGHGLAVYSPCVYANMYTEARESMELLDYSNDILEFYDAYVSLYLAYLGPDYVTEYAGSWYDNDIVSTYVAENTQSGEYRIETTVVDGYNVIGLSDEEWQIVSSIEAEVCMFIDEQNAILIGNDYYYKYDQYGNILLSVPENWIFINDHIASYACVNSYEDVNTGQWMQEGVVFAKCNGEEIVILIYYDNDNPSGKIVGYAYYDFESLSETEYGTTVFQFDDDDEVELIYPVINGVTGEIQYENVIGEYFNASDLTLTYKSIDWSNKDIVCIYTIYDIYGNTYETDSFLY